MKMKAAVVFEKNGPYTFTEVEIDEPKANEVRVKNVASGICHTDEFGRMQGVPLIKFPSVFGHEGAGIVEKVGADVKDFKPGDHVCFSYAFCGHCDCCQKDIPNYCENFNAFNFGGTGTDGTTRLHKDGKDVAMFFGQSSFAEYSVVNQATVVKVPEDIPLEYAAPMGCGFQTGAGTVLECIKPGIGDSIAVFGCGAVGMAAVMGALIARCEKVIAVDISPTSLALAKELGAIPINSKETPDVVAEIHKICPKGVSYAVNTTSIGSVTYDALRSTQVHGMLVSLAPAGVIDKFDVGFDILMHYRTFKGINQGEVVPRVFIPQLLRMYKEGLFPVDKMITVYPFDQIEQAVQDAGHKVLKAVLKIS